MRRTAGPVVTRVNTTNSRRTPTARLRNEEAPSQRRRSLGGLLPVGVTVQLQRTIGNRAVGALLGQEMSSIVQRNWGSTSLEAIDANAWHDRFVLINGWSIDYMLETFDELKKQQKLDGYLAASHVPANMAGLYGDRVIATMKGGAGIYDAEFYTCMAGLQRNDPQGYASILRRGGKKISEARIEASIPQLAVRLLAVNDIVSAGAVLDRLDTRSLLDALVVVVAAGHGAKINTAGCHPDAARANRIMVASDIAAWSSTPEEWATHQPTVAASLNRLSPADQAVVQAWVANKPELAQINELGKPVAEAGQFFFGSVLWEEIAAEISSAGANGDPDIVAALKASGIAGAANFWTSLKPAAKVINKSFPALKGLLRGGDASKKHGLAIYDGLWSEYEKTKTTAGVAKYHSFYDMQALAIAQMDRCNAQVRHAHTLHLNQASGKHAPSPSLTAGGLAQSIVEYRLPKSKSPWRGSEVRFISGLGGAVESMKAVLDAQDRIIMGVLSGATGSMTPEHYLYVVGYRGNTLICSDSDPNNEKPGVLPTKGITYLYYDPAANRLSSAPTDDAFPINWDPAVGDNRFQMSGAHRYQALSIAKLPTKR